MIQKMQHPWFCNSLLFPSVEKSYESYLVDESMKTLTMWECYFGVDSDPIVHGTESGRVSLG